MDLDTYFDKFMRISTSLDLVINVDTMHKYVVGPTTLKKMMRMLLHELDKGAQAVYPDAMEARVPFQKYVTLKYTDIIVDYRSWHHFTTVNHHENVEELVFQQLSESL